MLFKSCKIVPAGESPLPMWVDMCVQTIRCQKIRNNSAKPMFTSKCKINKLIHTCNYLCWWARLLLLFLYKFGAWDYTDSVYLLVFYKLILSLIQARSGQLKWGHRKSKCFSAGSHYYQVFVKALAELNQSVALYRDLVRHLLSAEDSLSFSVRYAGCHFNTNCCV